MPRPFFSRPQFGDDFALIADILDNKRGKKRKLLSEEQLKDYDMFADLEDIGSYDGKLHIDYNVMQGNSGIAQSYAEFNKIPEADRRADFWTLWDAFQKRTGVPNAYTRRGMLRGVAGRGAIRSSTASISPGRSRRARGGGVCISRPSAGGVTSRASRRGSLWLALGVRMEACWSLWGCSWSDSALGSGGKSGFGEFWLVEVVRSPPIAVERPAGRW